MKAIKNSIKKILVKYYWLVRYKGGLSKMNNFFLQQVIKRLCTLGMLLLILSVSMASFNAFAQENPSADKIEEVQAKLEEGDFFSVLREVKKILEKTPNYIPALLLEGEALLIARRIEESAQSFNRVLELNEKAEQLPSLTALLGLAKGEVETSKYKQAQERLLEAVQQYPDNGEAHYLLGRVEVYEKYYAASIKTLNKAYFLAPRSAPADFNKLREDALEKIDLVDARIYEEDRKRDATKNNKKKEIVEFYISPKDQLKKRSNLDPIVFNEFKFPSRKEDDISQYELLDFSSKNVELLDDTLLALYNDSRILFEEGAFDEVLINLDELLEQKPNFYPALYFRGLVYVKLEDYIAAEFNFSLVLEGNRRVGRAYLWRAMSRIKNGNLKNAADDLVLARKYALSDKDVYVISKTAALIWQLSKEGVISKFAEVKNFDVEVDDEILSKKASAYQRSGGSGNVVDENSPSISTSELQSELELELQPVLQPDSDLEQDPEPELQPVLQPDSDLEQDPEPELQPVLQPDSDLEPAL